MIPFEDVVASLAAATPTEKLAHLKRLQNGVVGHNQRKMEVVKGRGAESLVQLVLEPTGSNAAESLELRTRAVVLLGSLSLPDAEVVYKLLSISTHDAILTTLNQLAESASTGDVVPFSLLEALVRSLKLLYVDLIKVVGPRAWGTNVIGANVSPGERGDVRMRPTAPSVKGKERDVSMVGLAENVAPPLEGLEDLAERALKGLYDVEDRSPLSATSSSYRSTERGASKGLKFLLELLEECQEIAAQGPERSRFIPPFKALSMADMICSLLAGTIRLPYQRVAIAGEVESAVSVTMALYGLVSCGRGKVQESALNALSALCRDYKRLALLHSTSMHQFGNYAISDLVVDLMQSSNPSLRLAAVTTRTVIHKTLQDHSVSTAECPGEPLVPVLLALLESEPSARPNATFTLAHLIADNLSLQALAIKLRALETLRKILETPFRLEQPYATSSSLDEAARVQEGALLCIACLAASSDPFRHDILKAGLLPIIIASLSHPSVGVRAAACHCLRGLARSVHVLKTSLVEGGAAEPASRLLDEGEDLVVQITAAAAVSNMLLEFSPARNTLLELGCIARLCRLVRSPDQTLKVNALWALKNASYLSARSFKQSFLSELGWDNLASMIEGSCDEVAEQALAILRNLTVGIGDEPLTGLKELREDRMLALVERSLASESDAIVEQAIYVVVNVATADEATKLAIVARTQLLRLLISQLNHPSSSIRVAAVWVIINLTHRERSPRFPRKPIEIVAKLRAVGVEQQLKTMTDDASLDVRERVRQALEALALTPLSVKNAFSGMA